MGRLSKVSFGTSEINQVIKVSWGGVYFLFICSSDKAHKSYGDTSHIDVTVIKDGYHGDTSKML